MEGLNASGLKIVTIDGRIVECNGCRQDEYTIDISNLPFGIYFLLEPNSGKAQKFVKFQ